MIKPFVKLTSKKDKFIEMLKNTMEDHNIRSIKFGNNGVKINYSLDNSKCEYISYTKFKERYLSDC